MVAVNKAAHRDTGESDDIAGERPRNIKKKLRSTWPTWYLLGTCFSTLVY
eukprot:SAG11_NODE_26740_length_341_cov_0.946281_1_plen_49_part_01